VKLADLQRRLAENGQWLPLDPPSAPSATIGGILAMNASGPARIAYGTARDLVIGMMVATADGQLVKSGGRVVKNVAGYDMAKLHIGALGTLGVIVQATFKVAPLPKATRTLSIAGTDATALRRLAFAVRDAGLPASGIAISKTLGGPQSQLLLRFAGSLAAVDRSCLESERLSSGRGLVAEQAPESIWQEMASMRGVDGGVVIRVNHLPSRSDALVAEIGALNADVLAYATVGVTYARIIALPAGAYEAVRRLRATAEAGGGALILEAAPPEAKSAIGVWGTPRGDFELMRRLKAEMDPKATLSPGRFVGGI
jgi:glycolate oxidase FAD binding subunit